MQAITDGEFVITGPMYTGVRTFLGRTAVLEIERDGAHAQIVVTERPHEPFDLGVFTHAGIDPRQKRYIMLKSRIHYRAGFKPIAVAHRRVRRRRRDQRRPVGLSLPGSSPGRSSRST